MIFKDQLTEVFIIGKNNSVFANGMSQNLPVRPAWRLFSYGINITILLTEPSPYGWSRTFIDQPFHQVANRTNVLLSSI